MALGLDRIVKETLLALHELEEKASGRLIRRSGMGRPALGAVCPSIAVSWPQRRHQSCLGTPTRKWVSKIYFHGNRHKIDANMLRKQR